MLFFLLSIVTCLPIPNPWGRRERKPTKTWEPTIGKRYCREVGLYHTYKVCYQKKVDGSVLFTFYSPYALLLNGITKDQCRNMGYQKSTSGKQIPYKFCYNQELEKDKNARFEIRNENGGQLTRIHYTVASGGVAYKGADRLYTL